MYIVMELIDGGELFEKLANTGKYSEPDAKKICWRILKAVEYMHDNKVVHRDLKPENILLTRNDKTMIKITDFGLAKVYIIVIYYFEFFSFVLLFLFLFLLYYFRW